MCADTTKYLKRSLDIAAVWKSDDKFNINEEWRTMVADIENNFTNMANHVERFQAVKGEKRIYFVIGDYRQVPTDKKCNEGNLCKKCLL